MASKLKLKLLSTLGIVTIFSLSLTQLANAKNIKSGYHLLNKTIIGGTGGWDYLNIDNNRLYISHSDRLEIMDTNKSKIIGTIKNTNGIHGIAIATEFNKGFTSNGKNDTSTVFDLKTLKVLDTIKTGSNPDAVIYDSFSKHIFIFNGESANSTVIDPSNDKVLGTIALGGVPEFALSDDKGNIYVNIEDKSQTVMIDAKTMKVKSRWSLGKGEEPSGLAIDKKNHLLFIGCQNKFMVIMNTENGKIIDTLPIGEGVDATAFDETTGLAFSSNGEGTLDVIHEESPTKFKVVERVKTLAGARTMILDPKTHYVFLVTAKFGNSPAPTKDKPHPRKPIIPDTFMILEFGQK